MRLVIWQKESKINNFNFQVRVTAIIIEESKILLVKQNVKNRKWSLPGGRLEQNEEIEEALRREINEETGLEIDIDKFLYLTEKTKDNLIHLTFLCKRTSGTIKLPTNEFDENPISDVKFIEISKLEEYGFSYKFKSLIENDFPNLGEYLGQKRNIGL